MTGTAPGPIFHVHLRRKSWHYRLNDYVGIIDPARVTICRYFWGTVASLFIAPVLYVGWNGGKFAAFALVAGCFGIVGGLIMRSWIAAGILTVGCFGELSILSFVYSHDERPALAPTQPKNPSVLGQYLAAKKMRVCPYVEWEE